MIGEGTAWYALLHTPGPDVDGSVFAHPLFAEHVAFLHRLQERGWLIAAGPFSDRDGDGMTVVQVPDGTDIEALAREDDRSVAEGLFGVEIRPWDVRFTN
jgi:uncharacterized protein YciI